MSAIFEEWITRLQADRDKLASRFYHGFVELEFFNDPRAVVMIHNGIKKSATEYVKMMEDYLFDINAVDDQATREILLEMNKILTINMEFNLLDDTKEWKNINLRDYEIKEAFKEERGYKSHLQQLGVGYKRAIQFLNDQ